MNTHLIAKQFCCHQNLHHQRVPLEVVDLFWLAQPSLPFKEGRQEMVVAHCCC